MLPSSRATLVFADPSRSTSITIFVGSLTRRNTATERTGPPKAVVSSLRWSASGRLAPEISMLLLPSAEGSSVNDGEPPRSIATLSLPFSWEKRTSEIFGAAVVVAAAVVAAAFAPRSTSFGFVAAAAVSAITRPVGSARISYSAGFASCTRTRAMRWPSIS